MKGLVYLPTLNQWNNRSSNVLTVIQEMTNIFSQNPPLFATNNTRKTRTTSHAANNNSNTRPENVFKQFRRERSVSDSQRTVGNNSMEAQSRNSFTKSVKSTPLALETEIDPRAQKKHDLVAKITAKLQQRYAAFNNNEINEMDIIYAKNQELKNSEEKIRNYISALNTEYNVLHDVKQELAEKTELLEQWVDENKDKEVPGIDELVKYKDKWSEQLFDSVAKDHAAEDTMYELDRLLANEVIDLDHFMKVSLFSFFFFLFFILDFAMMTNNYNNRKSMIL